MTLLHDLPALTEKFGVSVEFLLGWDRDTAGSEAA